MQSLFVHFCCRSPRGERGLKYWIHTSPRNQHKRRSPRGERGLKLINILLTTLVLVSLPARGAWIEIGLFWSNADLDDRRSPRGERGLKSAAQAIYYSNNKVAPREGSVD